MIESPPYIGRTFNLSYLESLFNSSYIWIANSLVGVNIIEDISFPLLILLIIEHPKAAVFPVPV